MSEELAPRKPRVLPSMAICRATEMGIDLFADCLVERPGECPYALAFGYGFLCKHPHRKEIIANTKRFGRARAGDQNIASQE